MFLSFTPGKEGSISDAMNSPAIRTARRSRLMRDYTNEEDDYEVVSSLPTRRDVPRSGSALRDNTYETRVQDHRDVSIRAESINSSRRSGKRIVDQKYHLRTPRHETPSEYPEDFQKLDFKLDDIEEQNSYNVSLETRTQTSQPTGTNDSISSETPNFFGSDVFQTVLRNPAIAHQLLQFSRSRLCGENMEFLEKVARYYALLNDVAHTIFEIHRDFVSVNATSPISVDQSILLETNKDLKGVLSQSLPKLESVFVDSQSEVERLILMDIYPRFVRHQMTMSATKAMASDRGRYAGLGDCFVLTDPAKADNPIVYASDGFVKVTGYSRKEIIPRNCRFLQCSHTDRASVKRIRTATDKREESVELLLNQKKNGEPFWNLLYTAPLFDARGNTVFFLGGQINCSTTIHSTSDMLRILAQSGDVDDVNDAPGSGSSGAVVKQPQPSRTTRILAAFRGNSTAKVAQPIPTHAPGMENGLLSKIERLNLQKQMDTFYTAYSKFLVVNAATFVVHFHSAGILDLLFPSVPFPPPTRPFTADGSSAKPATPTTLRSHVPSPCGLDVFKFFASHSPEVRLPKGFKETVKSAATSGQAVSVSLTLCTRRQMGFESFIVHWTPLKDLEGSVRWLVVTMSGIAD